MHLPHIAAISTVAEDVPDTGRAVSRAADGEGFQSVFSGADGAIRQSEAEAVPAELAYSGHAPDSDFGLPEDNRMALPDGRDRTVPDFHAAEQAASVPCADPTMDPHILAQNNHSTCGGAGSDWAIADLQGTLGANPDVPPAGQAAGFSSAGGGVRVPGRRVPVHGVETTGPGQRQTGAGQGSYPTLGSGDQTGGRMPDLPSRGAGSVGAGKAESAARPDARVIEQGEGKPERFGRGAGFSGTAEVSARNGAVPLVSKGATAAPGASASEHWNGAESDKPFPLPAGEPGVSTSRQHTSDAPSHQRHAQQAMSFKRDVSSAAPGDPRKAGRNAPVPVAAPTPGHHQTSAATETHVPTPDQRTAFETTVAQRSQGGSRDGAAAPRATDQPIDATPETARPSPVAPSVVPIADSTAAPTVGVKTAMRESVDVFGADSPAPDAGLGEARVSARSAAHGMLPILQAPETPRAVVLQIVEILRASGERAVELRLQPEELGRLQLTMTQDASGTLSVALNAERAETLDLLRRNIDLLAAELRELGYESVDFSFEGDGARNDRETQLGSDGPSSAPTTYDGAAGGAASANTGAGQPDTTADGIDIRL